MTTPNNQKLVALQAALVTLFNTLKTEGLLDGTTEVQSGQTDVSVLLVKMEQAFAAIASMEAKLEQYRQDSFARNEVADLVREEMKKAGAPGAFKQEDLEEAIANYLNINDYVDSDTVDSKVEDAIDSHDFSTSAKMKRMVQDVVDEADLDDAVKNALDGITVNRYLDVSDLASDIENEIDFDSKVSDALDNIDLSDKLDIAPAVREQVDEALSEYDFSEALRNTLSDQSVRDALLKMLVEDLLKKLSAGEVK